VQLSRSYVLTKNNEVRSFPEKRKLIILDSD
jgi:hypothetical protein